MATQLTAGDTLGAIEFMTAKHGEGILAHPLAEVVEQHQRESGLARADAELLRAVEAGVITERELDDLTPFEIHNRVMEIIERREP